MRTVGTEPRVRRWRFVLPVLCLGGGKIRFNHGVSLDIYAGWKSNVESGKELNDSTFV